MNAQRAVGLGEGPVGFAHLRAQRQQLGERVEKMHVTGGIDQGVMFVLRGDIAQAPRQFGELRSGCEPTIHVRATAARRLHHAPQHDFVVFVVLVSLARQAHLGGLLAHARMIADIEERLDLSLGRPGAHDLGDRKSTRLNSSHELKSRMPSSA